MESYHKLTYDLIPGQTDREKYNSMLLIIELLNDLSFPKRGEEKSLIDLIEQALEISDHYIETKNTMFVVLWKWMRFLNIEVQKQTTKIKAMKTYFVYGVKMTSLQELIFSKHINNCNIAMNTKTAEERLEIAKKWLESQNV